MITQETKLQLQAYIDGELGDAERRALAQQLERDPSLRALESEWRELHDLLAVGEVEVKVPETREFYWSKIERAIQREQTREPEPFHFPAFPRWLRILAPTAGVAFVMAGALFLAKFSSAPVSLSQHLHEIETPLDDTGAISFHSDSSGMTVVWVQSAPTSDVGTGIDDFE